MNNFRVLTLLTALVVLITTAGETDAQEAGGAVTLTVRLRAADGVPIAGEPVVLQRLPEEEESLPACRTDATGRCSWQVTRGLYQVLFERPLDGVSALALAEGGLRGFGLTVGDEDIAYHFTFHDDGRVYFDSAPEAARPVPIIPTPELLLGGVAPTFAPEATLTPEPAETEPDGVQAGDGIANPSAMGDEASTDRHWRLLVFIALGMTAGSSLHLWTRCRKKTGLASPPSLRRPTKRPIDQTTNRRDDDHA